MCPGRPITGHQVSGGMPRMPPQKMMLLPVQMCSWSALGHSHRDVICSLVRNTPSGALNPKSRGPGPGLASLFLEAQLGRLSTALGRRAPLVGGGGRSSVVRAIGSLSPCAASVLMADRELLARVPLLVLHGQSHGGCPSMSWPPVSCRSLAQVTCLSSPPHVDQIGASAS